MIIPIPQALRFASVILCSLCLGLTAYGDSPLSKEEARPDEKGGLLYYDFANLSVEGKGWTDTNSFYDRLPSRAESFARKPVWNLGHQSAGICARFTTDATSITVDWKLLGKRLASPHMAATGASGVDLYLRMEDGTWRWAACGKPTGPENSATLLNNLSREPREFMLYLPLYNGVSSVEVGIPQEATISKAPERPEEKKKPIVFYGTSITQGASATRPGTCHPAILGRRFDRPVINLGFSGNGTMDLPLATLFAEIDPAVFIFDCLPNTSPEMVRERAEKFLRTYRKARPDTPILMTEDRTYGDAFIKKERMKRNVESRKEFRKVYDKLIADGFTNLYYLEGDKLLGEEGDDTVDGSHPTDLGFYRQAKAFERAMTPILE